MNEHSYRCDLCGERFDSDEQLREHWLEAHETREPVTTTASR
jgi:hypothetical protein